MYNDIENKIIKLEKKQLLIQMLLILTWIMSFRISAYAIENVIPMAELTITIINNYININEIYSDIFLEIMKFFYRNLSLIVYIFERVTVSSISKEIHKLENELIIILENEKKKKQKTESIDYEKIYKVYNIIDRFEKLPRNKQMEILNYIKGDLTSKNSDLTISIMELDEKHRNMLQTECEDILFPSTDELEKRHIKTKKK